MIRFAPATTALAVLAILPPSARAASESESWEREFAFAPGSAPEVHVANVWGEVVVRGHDDSKVVVRAVETRRAADPEDLARVRDHLWLEVRSDDHRLSLEVDSEDERRHWTGRCRRCELHVDFEILVPRDARVDVSSVMDGTVAVSDVGGPVRARHVNGDVRVSDIARCEALETVNGELDVAFATPPAGDCSLQTVNGDLVVHLPEGSGLDVMADLFNGRVISDFELAGLASEPTVEKTATGHGTRYRISAAMGLRLGAGGPQFDFESINGDVQLRRRQDQE